MITGRKLSATGIIARALSAHELNRGGSSFSPLDLSPLAWTRSSISTLYQVSTGETPVTGAGQDVGLRLDMSQGLAITGNLISIPEPTVSQLSLKDGALSDYTSVGDSLHEQWVEFENNTISSYAYMQSGDVPNVGTLTIDVWMLDSDTPPIIGAAAPANMGLVYKTASVPAPMVGIEKLEPFRYRLHCGPVFVGTSTGFGIVCYSANTFRPFRVSGYDVRRVEGNHAYQTTATSRPTYEGDRLEYDVDDALSCTLPAISGGQIVIISPAGTWIDSFDFAGGTFTVGPDTYTGGPAGLMSLLGNEEIEIVILPTPMTEAEQAKMVAYAKSIGSAGLITLGAELKPNSFSDGTFTNVATGASIAAGVLSFVNVAPGDMGVTQSVANGSPYDSTKKFLTTLTVSNYSSGGVRFWTGGGHSPTFTSNGVHAAFAINPADTTLRVFPPTSGANSTLDATISIREVIMP